MKIDVIDESPFAYVMVDNPAKPGHLTLVPF